MSNSYGSKVLCGLEMHIFIYIFRNFSNFVHFCERFSDLKNVNIYIQGDTSISNLLTFYTDHFKTLLMIKAFSVGVHIVLYYPQIILSSF